MQIDLGDFCLELFNDSNPQHIWLAEQFNKESKFDFISMIDSRLKLNNKSKKFPFGMAFVVSSSNTLLGYMFISSVRQDEVYLESSLLQDKRRRGIGKALLKAMTDYLFDNYNIKEIALDIYVSNEAGINTAISCDYYQDESIDLFDNCLNVC